MALASPTVVPDASRHNVLLILRARPGNPAERALALAIVIDRSASMMMAMSAVRTAIERVVNRMDANMVLTVIGFGDTAEVLFPAAACAETQRKGAMRAARQLAASGGTQMHTPLELVLDQLKAWPHLPRRVLMLTDGRNEGPPQKLASVLSRLREAEIEIRVWGLGLGFDEKQLSDMAAQTGGQADMIPEPRAIGEALQRAFHQMQDGVLRNVELSVQTAPPFAAARLRRVHPSIALEPAMPQMLGSLELGHAVSCLLELDLRGWRGERTAVTLTPSLRYTAMDGRRVDESCASSTLWIEWAPHATEHPAVSHYLQQEAVSRLVFEAHTALSAGDEARATALLTQARHSRHRNLIDALLATDANGTVVLRTDPAAAASRKTIALGWMRTEACLPDLEQ